MAFVGFKVWLTNEREFCSRDITDWARLPDDTLLAVRVFYTDHIPEPGATFYPSVVARVFEWYGLDPETELLYCSRYEDLANAEREHPEVPEGYWKRGVWTTDEDMERVAAAQWDFDSDYVDQIGEE